MGGRYRTAFARPAQWHTLLETRVWVVLGSGHEVDYGIGAGVF